MMSVSKLLRRTKLSSSVRALALGTVTKTNEISFEDLCFQLQYAVEKAMKALLIHKDVEPPITHSFESPTENS
jgi:hypothetical protein